MVRIRPLQFSAEERQMIEINFSRGFDETVLQVARQVAQITVIEIAKSLQRHLGIECRPIECVSGRQSGCQVHRAESH